MSRLTQVAGFGSLVTNMVFLALVITTATGHGRLYEPPGRSTMWRRGFNVPANYDDNELYCGGFSRQVKNGGRCGVCGDPWDGPRENEAGGKYATGVIARTYGIGQTIEVTVQVSANHKGYFEFRLCPNNNPARAVTQECLDKHLLPLADGSTRYYITTARTGDYVMKVKLPRDVICDQCVLQWRYHTGNSWGCDPDGRCCVGCGAQEEFYGCSDVAIKGGNSIGSVVSGSSGSTTSGGSSGSMGGSVSGTGPDSQGPQPQAGQCRATPQYAMIPQLDQWCEVNCSHGYCPESHCNAACRALMP